MHFAGHHSQDQLEQFDGIELTESLGRITIRGKLTTSLIGLLLIIVTY